MTRCATALVLLLALDVAAANPIAALIGKLTGRGGCDKVLGFA